MRLLRLLCVAVVLTVGAASAGVTGREWVSEIWAGTYGGVDYIIFKIADPASGEPTNYAFEMDGSPLHDAWFSMIHHHRVVSGVTGIWITYGSPIAGLTKNSLDCYSISEIQYKQ